MEVVAEVSIVTYQRADRESLPFPPSSALIHTHKTRLHLQEEVMVFLLWTNCSEWSKFSEFSKRILYHALILRCLQPREYPLSDGGERTSTDIFSLANAWPWASLWEKGQAPRHERGGCPCSPFPAGDSWKKLSCLNAFGLPVGTIEEQFWEDCEHFRWVWPGLWGSQPGLGLGG